MKFLVVSDNHGNRDVLVELAKVWQDKVDGLFHAGDSELEPTDSLWQKYVVVKGNCDYNPAYKQSVVVNVGDETIFMTHGHLHNVNMGLTQLSLAAKENQATICLYGHTHKLGAELVDGILYINSGSISQPRGKYSHLRTYAVVETSETTLKVTYYNANHEAIPELTFTFSR